MFLYALSLPAFARGIILVELIVRCFRDSASVSKTRTLSWWCFNPGIGMADFSRRGVGSVVLTSGTLSPMDSFAYELKL